MQRNSQIMSIISAVVFLLFCVNSVPAQNSDIEQEVNDVRRQLAKVQAERDRVKNESRLDVKENNEYRLRNEKRRNAYLEENNSIEKQISRARLRYDSLSVVLNVVCGSIHELELGMQDLKKQLIKKCDRMLKVAYTFPPLETDKLIAALSFLKNELTANSIHADEGLNRLYSIMKDLEELTTGIQVVQSASPVADIRGTVYRLRVGTIFEGIVDEKGQKCLLWKGNNAAGQPQWELKEDPAIAGELFKAAQLRNGKAVPDFVLLPLAQKEKEGGGK